MLFWENDRLLIDLLKLHVLKWNPLRRIDEQALIRNSETARRSRAVSNYESTLVSLLSDLNHDVIYYCPVHNNNTNRFVTLSILSKIELYYRQISSGDLNIAL